MLGLKLTSISSKHYLDHNFRKVKGKYFIMRTTREPRHLNLEVRGGVSLQRLKIFTRNG